LHRWTNHEFYSDPGAAAVVVLAASLPAASNAFIIAQRYRVDARSCAAAGWC
jgi:predicted permease